MQQQIEFEAMPFQHTVRMGFLCELFCLLMMR